MKRVQVTVELSNSFISMLRAELSLNGTMEWQDNCKKLTASQCLALAVYGESRGALEEDIHFQIPHEWRPDFHVVHENRKVLEPNPNACCGSEMNLLMEPSGWVLKCRVCLRRVIASPREKKANT